MERFRENKENCQQATNDPENPNNRNTIAIQDEGNSSLKEDELPGSPNFLDPQLVYTEDGNETDMFLNREYSKMMNTLPSQEEICPSIQEEDKQQEENKKKDTPQVQP